MTIDEIKTPAYVCEEEKLISNLKLLNEISQKSGAKVLCALKGFAFSLGMPYVDKYLNGVTCSGLHEAKYAKEYIKNGEIHTYSPAFKDEDIDEILNISNHIVFNSFNQVLKFKTKALQNSVHTAIRLNPQTSFSPTDSYNPCSRFSRLGITKANLLLAIQKDATFLDGIEGFHFHALCEESSESLEIVLNEFEEKFGEFIKNMKFVNFGGGHHITKKGYNTELLINLITKFRQKYGVEVYLEPGEAVGWQTGYLITSILDIVENEANIAILDTSAEAHMPDTVIMPYRPDVRNESKNGKFIYKFGGNTCLSGDIIGQDAGNSEYKFDFPLKISDKVIFEDQIHYTIVKNTTFNGIKLPDLHLVDKNGNVISSKFFGYEEYKNRN
ncbi:carboxynorspermidine decarboxylase [Campylobacter sputorum subsp. bubulus]|uniref:Carboxynorspermidine/carboxyspermidine decarboxylase n=1 Tax=Campylobacter sputorum subsp. sputorum TaxID=32024 RepID=A0A381DJ90_9BACT|nr:carboxynorspermidine decarboxylase [Campylobacter sputorum]ASM35771.1 carboxynorspermidine decarboxylase [Campylobacter sputorum aubsp. sputorum RM3237]KAB0581475.1 carboxynorspermidine decarboxylase [Campylobacter sputorum subsp. sputorum]QEL05961.1 carboxynorspermidine decarboxylase [Campylobacter sputorum subsp. sputorum]SUX09058.1 carboxynorspermidine decarboxylase [Campylobacter sputorum subsp. bubulus]SUX10749.1 carboxynorspermidine decarboxylase [Campylobacter sputorum subsp. sputoru